MTNTINNYRDLPLTLRADDIAAVLGISRAGPTT